MLYVGAKRALMGQQKTLLAQIQSMGASFIGIPSLSNYQDSAGTLLVTQPGGGATDPPVGKVLDLSGLGNHATQSTNPARPKLSARVNLLTKTEDFSAAVWANSGGTTVVTPGAIAPDGSATAFDVTFTVGSAGSQLYGTGLPTIAVPTKQRVYLRSATGVNIFYGAYDGGGTGGGGSSITLTSTWTAYDVSSPAFTGSDRRPLWLYSTAAGQQFQIWHPQLELGSTATRYQRVTDANTYDYSGFPFVHVFDGVDDAHVITFPSSLGSACTVVTANRGTTPTIQTGQTIGTSYTITTTHAGKLIFPRALTAAETAIVTAWATKQGAIA